MVIFYAIGLSRNWDIPWYTPIHGHQMKWTTSKIHVFLLGTRPKTHGALIVYDVRIWNDHNNVSNVPLSKDGLYMILFSHVGGHQCHQSILDVVKP